MGHRDDDDDDDEYDGPRFSTSSSAAPSAWYGMIYRVRARPVEDRLPELYRKLTDGSIARQAPDGREIVASMKRARLGDDGLVEWCEMCFCSPPLDHERRTVYDRYFTDFDIVPIDDYVNADGEPFMEVLASRVG